MVGFSIPFDLARADRSVFDALRDGFPSYGVQPTFVGGLPRSPLVSW